MWVCASQNTERIAAKLWNKTASAAGLGFSQRRATKEEIRLYGKGKGRKGWWGTCAGGEARCIQESGHLCSRGTAWVGTCTGGVMGTCADVCRQGSWALV